MNKSMTKILQVFMLTPTGDFPTMLNFVQSFSNCYSPDPNSDQPRTIFSNFQNVTDLNQIHIEGNVHLHEEHPNGLQRISSITARRTTQALENCIYDYSLFKGDPTENFVRPFTRPYNRAKRQQFFFLTTRIFIKSNSIKVKHICKQRLLLPRNLVTLKA